MTSARNTRVSFAKNAGIIGPLTRDLKTIKYFAGVNNLSQYNQYFFIISLKIETIYKNNKCITTHNGFYSPTIDSPGAASSQRNDSRNQGLHLYGFHPIWR